MALTKVSRGLLSTGIVDNSTTTAITIDSSENVGIGNNIMSSMFSTAQNLVVGTGSGNNGITVYSQSDSVGDIAFADAASDPAYYSGLIRYDHSLDAMRLFTASTERMRIDSSGNLLVGTTDAAVWDNTTGNGINLRGDLGLIASARSNAESAMFNRMGTDGEVIKINKNGALVGSIGTTTSAGGTRFAIGAVGDPGIIFAGTGVFPATAITASDNVSDLGSGTFRWKNVYRAGSTYSTSDRNMKQDIRELTDAERNVAVAAKGLLKAFRFIDRVEEEGNSANIHFGIIAQDLAAAFTAEGLDANDYQVYKAAVETDEDGNEQTRLNVCYENLLAFIIAAI